MDRKMKIISLAIWCLIAVFLTGVMVYSISNKDSNGVFSVLQPQQGNLKIVKEENVPLKDINNISLDFKSESITVYTTEASDIKIVERCSRNLKESQRFSMARDGDSLFIAEGNSSINILGIHTSFKSLELYIPKQYAGNFSVLLSSGSVKLENDLKLKGMRLVQQSGDIAAKGKITAENLDVKSTSGTVRLGEVNANIYNFKLTSGNLTVNLLSGSGRAECTSGNINISLKDIKDSIDIEAISGNITLHVPEAVSFRFDGTCTSGNIKSDFNMNYQGDDRSKAQAVNGSSPYKMISAKVTSGNISLLKTP